MMSAGGGGTGVNPAASQPPEQRFASQLEQLANMGFVNRQDNIQGISPSSLFAVHRSLLASCLWVLSQCGTASYKSRFFCSTAGHIWRPECSNRSVVVTTMTHVIVNSFIWLGGVLVTTASSTTHSSRYHSLLIITRLCYHTNNNL